MQPCTAWKEKTSLSPSWTRHTLFLLCTEVLFVQHHTTFYIAHYQLKWVAYFHTPTFLCPQQRTIHCMCACGGRRWGGEGKRVHTCYPTFRPTVLKCVLHEGSYSGFTAICKYLYLKSAIKGIMQIFIPDLSPLPPAKAGTEVWNIQTTKQHNSYIPWNW